MTSALAARDLRSLLDFSAELQAAEQIADLPGVLLPALLRMIDADLAGWNDIDLDTGTIDGHLYPDSSSASAFAGLSALSEEPPLLTHYRLHPEDRASRISDVCSQRAWHASPAYVDVYRHYGIEYQIGLPITTTATRIGAIALNRGTGDFSGTDRDVVTAARQIVETVHRRLLHTAAREAAIAALGPDAGWLLADDSGTVVDLGRAAANLLAAHGVRVEAGRPLAPLPPGVNACVLGGEFATAHEGTTLFALRAVASPRSLGLTPRQHDALLAVADGSTVSAAARRLDISPQTLATHLRDAYAVLGVSGRIAAINALREHGLLPGGLG